jgi:membrane protein YfhO
MTRNDGRAFTLALVLFSVFFSLVFLQGLRSRDYLIAPGDALDLGVADYLAAPSLWTEGLYSGYAVAADPQSLTWYPVLHLFRLLGLGWNVFMVAAYVVASAACFLLVRRLTGSTIAGIFGGFVFGFSGPMLGNLGHFNQLHSIAWAPLVLYGLQRIREGLHRSGAAVTAVAVALMWLAGHPQLPLYTSYLAGALLFGSLILDRPDAATRAARIKWSAIGMALGLGIAAVALVPLVELSGLSQRAGSKWELYIGKAMPPWQLLTLALPFSFGFWADDGRTVSYFGDDAPGENLAYVGLVPLALALAAPLVLSERLRREARLWVILAVVAALLCLGPSTPLGYLFYYAPGYARFRVPSRHLFLVALCVAVASGFALAELSRRPTVGTTIRRAITGVLALAMVAFAVLASLTPHVRDLVTSGWTYVAWALGWPLAVTVAVIALLIPTRWMPGHLKPLVVGALLIVAQVVDLGQTHYRVPGYRFLYADVPLSDTVPHPRIATLRDELLRTGERVLGVDGTHDPLLLPNLTRPWKVRAAGGSGPLATARYLDLFSMGDLGVGPEPLKREHHALDLFAIRYALVPAGSPVEVDLLSQADRWSHVDALQYDEDDPESRYSLLRNARARPPAWCVESVFRTSAGNVFAAIKEGRLPDGRLFDPATNVLTEPGSLTGWTDGTRSGETPVVTANSRDHVYRVSTRTPCVLVVSEQYYPWWRASVDDTSVGVSRVNYAMIGVPIPPGIHRVRLSIWPTSVWAGMTISVASLLVWMGLVVSVWRRRDVSAHASQTWSADLVAADASTTS